MEVLGGDTIVQLTFSTTVCPKLLLPEALSVAKSLEFRRIQLERSNSASSPIHEDTSVRMVRERLSSAEIELSGLTIRSLTGRKADSNERNLAYNLRQIEWDIHLARAIGTKNIGFCGGVVGPEAFEDLVEGIKSLINRVPDVNMVLINKEGSCFNSLEDARVILSEIQDPRFQIRIDTDEFLASGEDVVEYSATIGDRIGEVAIGCGNKFDFEKEYKNENLINDLFVRLKSLNFKGPVIIQKNSLPIEESIDFVRDVRGKIQKLIS